MKKGIFKLMTVAVGLLTMASCADDLGVGQEVNLNKGDLTGRLATNTKSFTRMGMYEGSISPWQDADNTNWGMVWTEGDQVRVYKVDQLLYNLYDLKSGWNTDSGIFELQAGEGEKLNIESGKDYAITDAQFVYGVSGTPDGGARLTYTIPYKYKAKNSKSDDGEDADIRKFPAPFWGDAKQNSDGTLDCDFMGLTAFLRIQMDQLPEKTKYIVLTTHGSEVQRQEYNDAEGHIVYNDIQGAGFIVAKPQANGDNPAGYYDTMGWWYQDILTGDHVDLLPNGYTGADGIRTAYNTGASEPLTGTFTTPLIKGEGSSYDEVYANTVAQTYLRVDEGLEDDEYGMAGITRLVTRDEMVIDVQNVTQNVFWVPIIAETYKDLAVIAATEISKKQSYCYIGYVLKNFTDFEFINGDYYTLTMSQKNLGKVCPYELNKAIAEINKANKYGLESTNTLNVEELVACNHTYMIGNTRYSGHSDDNIYPTDRVLVQGNGDLQLNILKISDEGGRARTSTEFSGHAVREDVAIKGIEEPKALLVTDYFPGSYDGYVCARDYSAFADNGISSVVINLPYSWTDPEATTNTPMALMSDLPTYDAIVAINNEGQPANSTNLVVDAHLAPTNFVSGKNLVAPDGTLKNGEGAALTVVNGIKDLNILEDSKGDVYIYPGNGTDVEVSNRVRVYTQEGINLRISDALAKQIRFKKTSNADNYVFTTGSAAMQYVGVIGDGTQTVVPNRVKLQSYWTGAALNSEYDGIAAYDNGTVYTVAQLASMGEQISGSTTANYLIDDLVTEMWLGGEEYPWIGAQVTVSDFVFDGNNKSLQNINMPEYAKVATDGSSKNIYIYDPHLCCTTCGRNPVIAGTDDIEGDGAVQLWSFGLIRSISKNANDDEGVSGQTTSAEIKNVNLNDVDFDDSGYTTSIDYVGSIVGYINSKSVTFTDNNVSEVKINVKGDNVGGMVGYVRATGDEGITFNSGELNKGNTVTGTRNASGYINGGNYVGGLIGRAQYGDVNITDAGVNLKPTSEDYLGGINASNSYAGGLIGAVTPGANDANTILIENSSVNICGNGNITATDHTGGLIGFARANGESVELNSDEVTVKNKIQATDGSYSAGFVGQLLANNGAVTIEEATVDVDGEISADNQFAGGLIGQSEVGETLTLVSGEIAVEKILSEEGYAGGVIGQSSYGIVNIGDPTILTATNDKSINEISVDVEKLASAYAAGGIVGNNENNSDVNINAAYRISSQKYGNFVEVEITEFENTKKDEAETYFKYAGNDANAQLAGTMSNIIGLLDGNLVVKEKNLTVTDHLDNGMKDAVCYKYHPDRQHNKPTSVSELYWGDYNGYVGWGNSGRYTIDGKGITADSDTGYNLYYPEAEYDDQKSKNAAE